MNDKLVNFWNKPNTKPTLIGVVSLGVGVGIGFVLGRYSKRQRYTYDQLAQARTIKREIEKELNDLSDEREEHDIPPKQVFEKVDGRIRAKKDPIVAPPIEVLKKGEEFVLEAVSQPPVVDELITRSVFEPDDGWNYELEEKKRKRNPDGPHVLHKDEFYTNELDLTQITLTYYAGDNIMSDEDNKPIYNHEEVTGPMLFGHGSGDPNVFYVRNLKRKCEYEICLDPGLFSVEVLGLQIEDNTRVKDLRHARAPGKFRDD